MSRHEAADRPGERLEIRVAGYGDPDVQAMIAAVQREYAVLYGGPDAAHVEPAEFTPPDGLFLVGSLGRVPVATGGWRVLHDAVDDVPAADQLRTAEIKRMYVHADARRCGFAREMLVQLTAHARDAGVTQLVLSTGRRQPEAIALYVSAGFEPIAPFGHYAAHEGAVFLGKRLPR